MFFGKYRELPPNDQLDLKALTLKTATLLTLNLCHRAQTIFTLDLRYIKKDRDAIHIAFPSMLKYSRPGRHLKPAILKRYLEETKKCPVEVSDTYLKATKKIRKSEPKLLISFLKPHSAVTVKTISRWVKTYLKEAGIDTNTFQGHSLRSSSSSKAKLNGAINYICEISGCKARSNTDCCRNRILTIKENLPSCTFIVILFLEQRVEIRTFLSSLPRFSN